MHRLSLPFVALVLLFLSLSCALTWAAVEAHERTRLLSVVFLDVGQGDAALITAPNGAQALIDGGASGETLMRQLAKEMPFFDRSIEVVIATHPDSDHIGGLSRALSFYEVDFLLRSGAESDSPAFFQFEEAVKEEVEGGAHELVAARGARLVLDEEHGVFLDVLFPASDMREERDANDASIVARLVYQESEFLFTGDADKEIEEMLVWIESERVEADVLKVGHHGSRTSTSQQFVGFVNPAYAIISAGKDNPYGHPHQEVLDTLAHFEDIVILQTANEGAVEFVSDGRGVVRR